MRANRTFLRACPVVAKPNQGVAGTASRKIRHADCPSRIGWQNNLENSEKSNHESKPDHLPGEAHLIDAERYKWEPHINTLKWGDYQKDDETLKNAYLKALRGNPLYTINNKLLHQLIEGAYVTLVPQLFRKSLIAKFHRSPPAVGHPGPERTYQQMKRRVYWPGMKADVEDFIEKCELCQRH